MARLPGRAFRHGLEIGCGTGILTKMLLPRFHSGRLVSIDMAPGMIMEARNRVCQSRHCIFMCCDAEFLPLASSARFDLVISASTMQWFSGFYDSLERIISGHVRNGGVFLAAFFGKNTLPELAGALSMAFPDNDNAIHTGLFPEYSQVQNRMNSTFPALKVERCIIQRDYSGLMELLRALKFTGATPRMRQRHALLRSARGLRLLEQRYLELYGALSASYEVILISGTLKR